MCNKQKEARRSWIWSALKGNTRTKFEVYTRQSACEQRATNELREISMCSVEDTSSGAQRNMQLSLCIHLSCWHTGSWHFCRHPWAPFPCQMELQRVSLHQILHLTQALQPAGTADGCRCQCLFSEPPF